MWQKIVIISLAALSIVSLLLLLDYPGRAIQFANYTYFLLLVSVVGVLYNAKK